MMQLTDPLAALGGAYGYAGYRETGLPPCGVSSYIASEAPIFVYETDPSGACLADPFTTLIPNEEGEWALALESGIYCFDDDRVEVSEGLWTERALNRF